MRTKIRKPALLLSIFLNLFLVANSYAAKSIPEPPRSYVYDEPGMLGPESQEISNLLANYDQKTSNQMLVAVFNSLEDEDLVDYTNRLFANWKIGQSKKDNGLLVAIFQKEKKIRIEVGYGLEPVVTDAFSKRVIESIIGPAFKQGQYGQGVLSAVLALQQKISNGDETPAEYPREKRLENGLKRWVFIIFFLMFIFLKILSGLGGIHISHSGRTRTWNRNSGFGGFGGPFGGGGGGFGGGGFGGGGGRSGGGGASGGW